MLRLTMRTFAYALLASLLIGVAGYGGIILTTTQPAPPTDASSSASSLGEVRPVNAVLGNAGFRAVFGRPPTPRTPEHLRLQTHLAYVEAVLRNRPRPSLSTTQRARRSTLLDSLRAYWTAGQFPQNTEVPGRSPVFIDEQGRLCAVGHLLAVSAGRSLAESVDRDYHLASVREIHHPKLETWARKNGFSRRELALIQPQYEGDPCCYLPNPEEEENASPLEITSLSASVGASLLNGVLLERGSPSVVGGAIGVAGGGTSLALGLSDGAQYPTASTVAGATSLVLGGWNLIGVLQNAQSDRSTASDQSSQSWSLTPTTMTTPEGSQPGIRASIQF